MEQTKQSICDNFVWTKTEGAGLQHGFDLKEELKKNCIFTLPDILENKAKLHDSLPCMGVRKLLSRSHIIEGKKTFEKLSLGDYEWKSYKEVYAEVSKVSAGLKSLGFEKGKRVVLLAETRAEWFITALGCLKQGIAIVTLYTSLNDEGIIHGIEETEVDTVFTSFSCIPRISKLIGDCKKIKHIILFEDQLEGIGDTSKIPDHIKIMPFSKLLQLSSTTELSDSKPEKDDIAIIMYTSGSTGNPKAVEISHWNIYHALISYCIQANLTFGDRYIAYLPLAHIMELVTETAMLALGVTIIYSSPYTLTNHGAKIAKGTIGDCQIAKPTAMTAVPLILDRIIKQVMLAVEKQSTLKKMIFSEALRMKQQNGTSFTSKIVDVIVFNKVKAELGGCMKMVVVGGAPLSPQTHSMIKAMFGCTLQVGYGCTETTASISAMECDDNRTGHCGPPNCDIKIQLQDWEEGDYKTTDLPRPRGEIIVGGHAIAKGYFKNPEETEAAFFNKDGIRWFRTGDIGEFDDTGALHIIDRKKDLVKLKHGEYVSLGGVESKLKTLNSIENICLMADSNQSNTVAVVVPNKEAYMTLCFKSGLPKDISFEDACLHEKGVDAFLQELTIHGKKNGLSHWDIPRGVHLSPHQWTPDSGLVTAALKLRRKPLQKEYCNVIKELYCQINKD